MCILGIKENDRLPAVVFSAEKLKKVEMQQNSASNETKYDVEKGGDSGKLFHFFNLKCQFARSLISMPIRY